MSFSFARPSDYEFEVGDRVFTVYGEVGLITDICTCDSCKKRGFYEPTWINEDSGDERYITNWEAETGFSEYRQIGKYKFDNIFAKGAISRDIEHFENVLAQRKKQLERILAEEKTVERT